MPTYAVTGKLGGGKTLFAVQQAVNRLEKGLKVAANVDLYPERFFKPWWDQSRVRFMRVPDRPSREDLDALGIGNETSDETKNGLLILDEAATILNARTFQNEGRSDMIDWFLHARKLGWDLIFISQSLSMLDKQIRDALVEYLVVVRRFDRYRIPFLAWFGIKINMPRVHFAIVRYGTGPNSMVSERIFFRGNNLFNVYDTRQLIMGQVSGCYSVLSPYHLKGRFMKVAQIAKIAARSAWFSGIVLGALVVYLIMTFWPQKKVVPVVSQKIQEVSIVRRTDGTAIVLLPDGNSTIAHSMKTDRSGTTVTTDDGRVWKVVQ